MVNRSTVLIVEDDVQLAELTCEVVGLAGASGVYRTSLDDAIDFLVGNAAAVMALLTDINLQTPMGGIELAVHVSQEWPDIAICVTSGVALERPKRLPEKAAFLAKPWRTPEIVAFVQAASKSCQAAATTPEPLS